MRIANLIEAVNQLRPFLFQFMVEEGYFTSEKPTPRDYFLCPNPNHRDTSPSAHILHHGKKGYCHGCSKAFDIVMLNHWKNSVPISGIGFITNNLMPLCKRFGVPLEVGDLTEEDKFKIDVYNANRIAADYIVHQRWSDTLRTYVESRGLTVEKCRELGIGVCPSYDAFEAHMKQYYTNVFLREASFLRPGVFGPNNIIFSIKDTGGSTVGFIARDLKFEEKFKSWEEKGRLGAPPRKYDSSSESNHVYVKRELLFGFSDFLTSRGDEDTLYVVEGQFDWAILKANDFNNCIALSGKALTPTHLESLRQHKIKHIVLVLDGDRSGREGVQTLLLGQKDKPGILSTVTFCKISVVELPDGEDPNSFVIRNGIQAFKDLPVVDSFSWALNNQEPDQDPVKTCEVMIPFIMMEPNFVRREQLIRALADVTGHSFKAIEDEILRREDITAAQTEREIEAIAADALRQLQHGDAKATHVLRQALERAEELDRVNAGDPLSIDETVAALDLQIETEAKLDGPSGFRFLRLNNLQVALNGDMNGTVNAIGGVPNTGKTALQSQLGKELVTCNDDTIVIMHTIDDNRIQMNRRLAVQFAIDEAIRLGMPIADKLTLNKMANPKFYIDQYPVENAGLMDIREFGYNKLRDLLLSGRLIIKDMTHGATIEFLEKMVKRAVAENPGKKVVAILDNFHKTQDFSSQDERTATKRKSQYLKTNIAQGYGVTVFSTFEYKKIEPGVRPTNNDLREAVNIEYDINYLEHLYSPLNAAFNIGQEEKCLLWHGHPFNKLPIIEGDIGKNKVTEVRNIRHYYKFYPAQSRYETISPDEAQAIVESNRVDTAREEGKTVTWVNGKKVPVSAKSETSPLLEEVPF